MRPAFVLFPYLLLLTTTCAHAPLGGGGDVGKNGEGGPKRAPSAAASPSASAVPASAKSADIVRLEDADGDGVADPQDGCPLDPGDSPGVECPAKWGYFFLRVIDVQRLPIKAALAFQPSVNKMVVAEDGYSGVLRPGTYELRVEAPGFKPAIVTFEVVAEEKALVEVELLRHPEGSK